MSDHTGQAIIACENCATALQGHYCHVCGQSIVSPVRHVGHAFEEVVESFLHLDGRIWRTLKDLVSPGRVAVNYLAGHRVRYVAPLRLFLVLSLVTFFVAQFTVHFDSDKTVRVDEQTIFRGFQSFEDADTVAQVQQLRDQRLAAIRKTHLFFPGGQAQLDALVHGVEQGAQERASQLQPEARLAPAPAATSSGDNEFSFSDKPWDEKANPVRIGWLPQFANAWVNREIGHAKDNLPRISRDPELLKHTFLSAVPTVLFVLVPVFAFLLKVAYARQKRLYLEHLVVALYSHAYLLLVLLAACVLIGVGAWAGAWAAPMLNAAETALWLWIPVYLWLMQKRVYRQGGVVTTLKFVQMGVAYSVLVTCGALLALLIGLVRV